MKARTDRTSETRGDPPPPTPTVTNPTISPIDGSYPDDPGVPVVITEPDATAAYYYVTDGSAPTEASTPVAPFTLDTPGVYNVRARGFEAGKNPSGIVGRTYTIFDSTPPAGDSWDVRKMQPLPEDGVAGDFLYGEFSTWPGPTSPHIFIATDGDDGNDGSTRALAVATFTRAQELVAALPTDSGDRYVICRGGIYWIAAINWTLAGTAASRIWIASDPGEIARLAFCIQLAHDDPAAFWNPVGGAVPDEFISASAIPTVGGSPTLGGGTAWIAASMTPLQNVNQGAFEATDEFVIASPKDEDYYGGPGTRKDASHFMRVRLTHTNLKFLETCDRLGFGGDYNWKGATDAQQIPMFLSLKASNKNIRLADYCGLRDIVTIGGGGDETVNLVGKTGCRFNNWWSYGSTTGLSAVDSPDTHLEYCKLRGQNAPWTTRAWNKYHGSTGYGAILNRCPGSSVKYCWVQHSHEGVRFDGDSDAGKPAGDYECSHTDFFDINDDCLYMPGKETSGIKDIFLNRFRAVNQSHPTTGQGTGQIEESAEIGVHIRYNLEDRRWGVQGGPPRGDTEQMNLYYSGDLLPDTDGVMFMTHGGDNYERLHIWFYHNTVLSTNAGGAKYYRALGNASKFSVTDIYNNILQVIFGNPREDLDLPEGAVLNRGFNIASSQEFPGFVGAIPDEIYADPKFANVTADRFNPDEDVRLTNTSPARGAGRVLEASYRLVDFSAVAPGYNPRDCGAVPYGVAIEPRRIFGPWSEV